ncbi:sensor histidine kinase [Tumebacillus flagellatus]|uniref:Heme sensor protein HssS n=1 Tax=Tumebacillus flagellatus TaxID=1157490 RepID=A0A074LVD8_9BACL|nr:HAMP domain-containing sensor histidine kinase [Tumebacillus flagellatus]KEO83953.1 hypothetical protein EL26_07120 [Tumebacillus flagellatus]
MTRSLYVRMVLTFLVVVVLSLVVSFFVTNWLYLGQYNRDVRSQLEMTGQLALKMVPSASSDQELEVYMKQLAEQFRVRIGLFDDQGHVRTFASPGGPPQADRLSVSTEAVQQVLSGKTYSHSSEPPLGMLIGLPGEDQQDRFRGNRPPMGDIVGLPYTQDGHRGALILEAMPSNRGRNMGTFVNITLMIVLVVGSLLIVVASRYLVKPLRAMKAATEQLAKGNFDIRLSDQRGDEFGTLAKSFNRMAVELRQIEASRQDFVSNVSHEIQSPLTSIKGFSKALLDDVADEADRKRYAEIIYKESDRLSRLSENLLRLASLQSEHHPFQPKAYELDEQLRQIVVAHEPQWAEKDIEIDLEDLPRTMIVADEDLLSQVWTNLLSNAIKHTPRGGTISITLTEHRETLEVAFQDSGPGIPEEEREKIFERFYKLDKSRNRTKSGSGIGLAIVKKILDLHEGAVSVAGSTFTVTLKKS